MGWGKVDPAPPALINTVLKGKKRRKEKRGGRKRETIVFFRVEGDRKREQEGFFLERKKGTEKEKQ